MGRYEKTIDRMDDLELMDAFFERFERKLSLGRTDILDDSGFVNETVKYQIANCMVLTFYKNELQVVERHT